MAENDPNEIVSLVLQRRDESKRWLRSTLWDELTEVYRSIKCRTKPIYKRDQAGKETSDEDTSRTNVDMPDLNIIFRRNVARVTAQPYRLRYLGGDEDAAGRMSALSAQQYDRSDEHREDVRVVMGAEAFGFSYSKLYWDKLARMMPKRLALTIRGNPVPVDRASLMQAQGAPEDEIKGAVDELGKQMNPDEMSALIAQHGSEIKTQQEYSKYEGPLVKSVFPGDLFLEVGALTCDASDYQIEQYIESDLWVKKMMELTYKDDDGQEIKAFDEKLCNEMLSLKSEPVKRTDDLRSMFESALKRETQSLQGGGKDIRPRKKFDILEQHLLEADGRRWITWVCERVKGGPIGRMPYPWDLDGKSAYTEYVPLPDMISCYGDATPRLLRYLHALHNQTVAQNFDYITNLLKRFVVQRTGNEIDQEVITRGTLRLLTVKDINGIKVLDEPPLPSGAFERTAEIMNNMGIAEPSLTAVQAGTDSNPMAGKTATTAVLASKASDALTQFKLDNRDIYLRDLGYKKLRMNQQYAEDGWEIQQKHFGSDFSKRLEGMPADQMPDWALTDKNGSVYAVKLDPLEIQDNFEIEPEAGSYLAVDDELKRGAAQDLQNAASIAPDIFDRRKVARLYISTIRGVGNPDEYILPEAPPPGPPPPKINVNFGFTGKLPDVPSEVVNELMQSVGLPPSQELDHQQTLKGIAQLSDAADQVDNLTSPTLPAETKLDQQINGPPSGKPAKPAKPVKTAKPKK